MPIWNEIQQPFVALFPMAQSIGSYLVNVIIHIEGTPAHRLSLPGKSILSHTCYLGGGCDLVIVAVPGFMTSRSHKPAGEIGLQTALSLAIGLPCLAFAIWGIWVCGSMVHSLFLGPDAGLNRFAAVLSWPILFGPFALFGIYVLTLGWKNLRLAQARRRQAERVQILPPLPSIAETPRATASVGTRASAADLEPLDDATRRHLDMLASRAAKLVGTAIGLFFLIAGITGLVLAWIRAHSPPDALSRLNHGITDFRLTIDLILGCCLSVLTGGYILRQVYGRPHTAWPGPLHGLSVIVSSGFTRSARSMKK